MSRACHEQSVSSTLAKNLRQILKKKKIRSGTAAVSNWSNLDKQKCIQIELRQIFLKFTYQPIVNGTTGGTGYQSTNVSTRTSSKKTPGPVPDNIWVAVAVSLTEHLHQPLYLLGLSRHSKP